MNDITFMVEDSRNLQNQLSPLIFPSLGLWKSGGDVERIDHVELIRR